MAKPVKYIVRMVDGGADVVLTSKQIEMLHLLAQGFEQTIIADRFSIKPGTGHNYFTILNELTDSHNPQELVGWSFKYHVLLAVDRKIIINPNLEIFER